MQRTRSSSHRGGGGFGGAEPAEVGAPSDAAPERDPDDDMDDGAEDGGSGSGTAREVKSRCGNGSVRSGRRRDRPGVPGCCGGCSAREFGGPPGLIAPALSRSVSRARCRSRVGDANGRRKRGGAPRGTGRVR